MGYDQNLDQRLRQLESTMAALEGRLRVLEGNRPSVTPTVITAQPTLPSEQRTIAPAKPKRPALYPGLRLLVGIISALIILASWINGIFAILGIVGIIVVIAWPWRGTATAPVATPNARPGTPPVPATPAKPRAPSQFERDFAQHWFSWLGIISLIVGVGLLLNYSLRGLGPLGNIITAYVIGAMLFGLWAWLRGRYRGFAFILQSGAWAILFIATYYLHAIPNPPLTSAVIDGILLLVLVGVMVMASIAQRSRSLTAGAFFLGYVAAVINTVDVFTLSSLVLLAVGLIAVAINRRWMTLILAGNLATFAVQAIWMFGRHVDLSAHAVLASEFLIFEVLLFGLAHWWLAPKSKTEYQQIIASAVVNLAGFFGLFQYLIAAAGNTNGWLASLFLAVVLGLLAALTRLMSSRGYLQTTYTVFAVGFLTVGLAQHFHDQALAIALLVECGALTIVGTLARNSTIRFLGYITTVLALSILAVVMSTEAVFGQTMIHARLVVGILGVATLLITAGILRERRSILVAGEKFADLVHVDAAVIIIMAICGLELHVAWIVVAWSILGAILVVIGALRHSFNARVMGYALAVASVMHWIATDISGTDMATIMTVHTRVLISAWLTIVLFGQALLLRLRPAALRPTERWLSAAFSWSGVVVASILLGVEVANRLLSIAWGIEGIILYTYGFSFRSLQARRQGLAVLIITIGKVYIVDVRTLTTPYRIVSFILLGAILLGIGFFYNRWRNSQAKKPPLKP